MQQETTTIVGGRLAPPVDLIRDASLFLDFDGTLVDIADRPEAVIVSDRLLGTLAALESALPGRVAIVTGRPLAQIAALLEIPQLVFSGSHGAEMLWPDGSRRDAQPPAWLAPTRSRLETFGRSRPGVLVETKPFGIALHYRQAPDEERACRSFAENLAEASDIEVLHGKMVVELRMLGADKGAAVATFMNEPPMAGTRPLVFGDDVTDEAAFAMARKLGGAGVLVGADRPSAARYRLEGVTETIDWLAAATEAAA
ncbi:trehalose-phosphatase [Sphingomonas sp.]|uniref:trehalose-phosphatase n=1 Tax=Sphingomonas sp. TaxID=28214 RepID=UPI000DB61697|nr:trehalose-phosphatase [Sphingomonas sp.]PZU06855.1 MAG: trehalose-phosphatase [Sphingomonas sp.]